MESVYQFLKECGIYYLATVEDGQPHVRPFATVNIFENKLYIQSGKKKNVAKQIASNPKVEICAVKDGIWLRLQATLVEDPRIEAINALLDNYPDVKAHHPADDGNTMVWYMKDAIAIFNSFTKQPKMITF